MNFRIGDPVVHWTYGIGQVIRREERAVSGVKTLYYAVKAGDLTIWVPADDKLEIRLRPPTPQNRFKHLLTILSSPGEPLPDDSRERRLRILELLKDGRAETLCRAIRDLSAFQHVRPLNDYDQSLMKRLQATLIGEWGFVLSVTPEHAAQEMHRLLSSRTH
jgi:RNA polymerase-interacting CarD/CdnL/TRCF family regulator